MVVRRGKRHGFGPGPGGRASSSALAPFLKKCAWQTGRVDKDGDCFFNCIVSAADTLLDASPSTTPQEAQLKRVSPDQSEEEETASALSSAWGEVTTSQSTAEQQLLAPGTDLATL